MRVVFNRKFFGDWPEDNISEYLEKLAGKSMVAASYHSLRGIEFDDCIFYSN